MHVNLKICGDFFPECGYTLYSPSPAVLLRSFRALLSFYFYLFLNCLFFKLFIYLWLFIAVCSLYLVVVHGFVIVVAFLVTEQALRHMGFSSYGARP